jgi:hypothetical protein
MSKDIYKVHEIEKGIPIPDKIKAVTGRPRKYPIAEMEVGDSIAGLNRGGMYASATSWTRRNNKDWEFTTRMNLTEPGYRMWRTK